MTFEEWQKQEFGYDVITTFWDDFAIADRFGVNAVIDTYNRSFDSWKTDYKYMTELSLVLNHRLWMLYNKYGDCPLTRTYNDLWLKHDLWCKENLVGEAGNYYFEITD